MLRERTQQDLIGNIACLALNCFKLKTVMLAYCLHMSYCCYGEDRNAEAMGKTEMLLWVPLLTSLVLYSMQALTNSDSQHKRR